MRVFNEPDHDGQTGRPRAGGPPAPCKEEAAADGTNPASSPPLGPITVDWKLFEHHLADEDLTEDEKREFLQALWYIVVTFVDLGFGIEPVQQAMRLAAAEASHPAMPDAGRKTDSSLGETFGKAKSINTIRGDDPGRKQR